MPGFFQIFAINAGVAKILCSILKLQSCSLEILIFCTNLLKMRLVSVVDKGEICNATSHFVRVGYLQLLEHKIVLIFLIGSSCKSLSEAGM